MKIYLLWTERGIYDIYANKQLVDAEVVSLKELFEELFIEEYTLIGMEV